MFHLRTHILDEDDGAGCKAKEGGVTFRRLQVEADDALVAMEILVIGAVAAAYDVFSACVGRLDADDICAPVSEMTDGGWAGAGKRKVENDETMQW